MKSSYICTDVLIHKKTKLHKNPSFLPQDSKKSPIIEQSEEKKRKGGAGGERETTRKQRIRELRFGKGHGRKKEGRDGGRIKNSRTLITQYPMKNSTIKIELAAL